MNLAPREWLQRENRLSPQILISSRWSVEPRLDRKWLRS